MTNVDKLGDLDDPHDLIRFVNAQEDDYKQALAEAEAYLLHPVLGPRLVECAEAAVGVSLPSTIKASATKRRSVS